MERIAKSLGGLKLSKLHLSNEVIVSSGVYRGFVGDIIRVLPNNKYIVRIYTTLGQKDLTLGEKDITKLSDVHVHEHDHEDEHDQYVSELYIEHEGDEDEGDEDNYGEEEREEEEGEGSGLVYHHEPEEVEYKTTFKDKDRFVFSSQLNDEGHKIFNILADILETLHYKEKISDEIMYSIVNKTQRLLKDQSAIKLSIKPYNENEKIEQKTRDRIKILLLAAIFIILNETCLAPSIINKTLLNKYNSVISPEYIIDMIINRIPTLNLTILKNYTVYFISFETNEFQTYVSLMKNKDLFKKFVDERFNNLLCNVVNRGKGKEIEYITLGTKPELSIKRKRTVEPYFKEKVRALRHGEWGPVKYVKLEKIKSGPTSKVSEKEVYGIPTNLEKTVKQRISTKPMEIYPEQKQLTEKEVIKKTRAVLENLVVDAAFDKFKQVMKNAFPEITKTELYNVYFFIERRVPVLTIYETFYPSIEFSKNYVVKSIYEKNKEEFNRIKPEISLTILSKLIDMLRTETPKNIHDKLPIIPLSVLVSIRDQLDVFTVKKPKYKSHEITDYQLSIPLSIITFMEEQYNKSINKINEDLMKNYGVKIEPILESMEIYDDTGKELKKQKLKIRSKKTVRTVTNKNKKSEAYYD